MASRHVRGWYGFYNGHYIRSALEYAYAHYLDTIGQRYDYEGRIFEKDGETYKPDFYLYGEDGTIERITEIKGESGKLAGIEKAKRFEDVIGLPITVLSYKDLVQLYRKVMPERLNAALVRWKTELSDGLGGGDVSGENNPRYHAVVGEETRKKIARKARERFKDPDYKAQITEKLIEHNRANGFASMRGPRPWQVVERKTVSCEACGKEFEVRVKQQRRFCSKECASSITGPLAAHVRWEYAKELRDEIKEFVEQWAREHAVELTSVRLNKITPLLGPMKYEVERRFGIKDWRILSKAIFGEDRGRKELVLYMQGLVLPQLLRF